MGQKIAFATANQNWEAKPEGWGWRYDNSTSPPTKIPGTQGDYDWLNFRVKNSCFNGFPFPILETYWSYKDQVEKPVTVWDGLSKAPDDNINFGTPLVGPGTLWCLEFNNLEDLFQYYWRVKKIELTSGSVKSECRGYYWRMENYSSIEYNASNENPKLSFTRNENPVLHKEWSVSSGFRVSAAVGRNEAYIPEDDSICPTDNFLPNDVTKGPYPFLEKEYYRSEFSDCVYGEVGRSMDYEGIIYNEYPSKSSSDQFCECQYDQGGGRLVIGDIPYNPFNYPVYKVGGKYYAQLCFRISLSHQGSIESETQIGGFSGPRSDREFPNHENPLTPGTFDCIDDICGDLGEEEVRDLLSGYGLYGYQDWRSRLRVEKKIININYMALGRQIATAKWPILTMANWWGTSGEDGDGWNSAEVTISDDFTFETVEYYEYANSDGQPIYDKTNGAQLRDPVTGQ